MGEFEKDIREMFQDLEMQIDTDQLWAGIEKKLDKKDRKFPVWWILLSGVLLVISFSLIILNDHRDKNAGFDNMNKSSLQNELHNSIYGKKPEIKTIQKNNFKDKKIQPSRKNNDLHKNVKLNNKFNPIAQAKFSNEELFETQNEIANNTINDKKTNKLKISNNEKVDISIDKRIIINLLPEIKEKLEGRNILPEYGRNIGYSIERESKKTEGFWKKSMDLGIGFGLVDKKLKSISPDFVNYLEKRVKTESYLESLNAEVLFNFKHSLGFFISTGINYSQIDERFKDNDSIDIYKKNDGITKEIQDSDGTITFLRGQKEIVQHLTWDKVIYNYYVFIELPVSVGYSFNRGKAKIELSSGISYNLKFFRKGQIIGTEGFPVDIGKEKGIFINSTGLSFISGMKILIPYRKHTFYFQPTFKYHLQSITDRNYPLEQRYLWYGVKFGYRFDF